MTDPIADMLTRLRNASAVGKEEVLLPMSKIKYGIAKILQETHWLAGVEVIKGAGRKNGGAAFDQLKIVLKYREDGRPAITSLKRISRPSRRVYVSNKELPRVLNNLGLAIISTPQGLMTNKEAGKKKLGGEVICEIY